MTESELASIESRAGVRLPQRYGDVVLNYPQPLLDMAEVYPGPKGTVQRIGPENAELYAHAELLEVANLADVDHKLSLFPAHYFIIGDSGCGDFTPSTLIPTPHRSTWEVRIPVNTTTTPGRL
jgi:hypothetical protein